MSDKKVQRIQEAIRRNYGGLAQSASTSCGCCGPSCCSGGVGVSSEEIAFAVGYSIDALSMVPQTSNLGLGCGNPIAIAALKPGETVLDVGSGGGFDAFLAARAVGEIGRIIGVDATPEMVQRARRLAADNDYDNVEFRLGEMENLPVADSSVDVVISNCVINLSRDKPRVLQEVFRVLKPGGRVAVSDVVATADLPPEAKNDPELHASCIAGACTVDQLEAMLSGAGFVAIQIQPREESKEFIRNWSSKLDAEEFIASAIIEAVKPD